MDEQIGFLPGTSNEKFLIRGNMNKDKVIESRYANKMVNPNFYGIIKVEDTGNKNDYENIPKWNEVDWSKNNPGLVWVPYIPVCTHTSITGPEGTKRIRNVSRWFLFKLWVIKTFSKFK